MPALSQKVVNTTTWGASSNTSATITDPYVRANSAILFWVTGATPAAGVSWSVNISNGSFYFVSSDAENTALPVSYVIL